MSVIIRLTTVAGTVVLVAFLGLLVAYLVMIDLSSLLPRTAPFLEPIVALDAVLTTIAVRWLMRRPSAERGRQLARVCSVLGSTLAILSVLFFVELFVGQLVDPTEDGLGAAGASVFAVFFMAVGAAVAVVGYLSGRNPRP